MKPTWLALFAAVSCSAVPPFQAGNDSEALYRKMEAALASAKTAHVEFESAADGSATRGSLKIEDGNKLDLKVDGRAGAMKYSLALKCDGKKMKVTRTESPRPPIPLGEQPELDAPANLTANVAVALARGGTWLAQEVADEEYRRTANPWFEERQQAAAEGRPMKALPPPPAREAATLHTLSNFRPGKAEGGWTAVTYDLVPAGERPIVITTFTVWIDAKGMPMKREGQFFNATPEGKATGPALSKWTEKYTWR